MGRGRPRIENPRIVEYKLMLTEDESKTLKKASNELCMNRAELIREAIGRYLKEEYYRK
jgi:metal-responsive CopG/Arc/MetJ family transcriptional regulator